MSQLTNVVAVEITETGATVFGPFDTEDDARNFIAWNRTAEGNWDVQEIIQPNFNRRENV